MLIVWQTSSRRGLPEALAQAHVSESHAGTAVACLDLALRDDRGLPTSGARPSQHDHTRSF